MSSRAGSRSSLLRTWLILGRVSNLPTVWSNCLAAWLLSGGGSLGRWMLLLTAASCVYVAGMLLNDACDADFDRRHRSLRPIPAGWIEEWQVWVAGGVLLVLGWMGFAELGWATGCLGLGLAGSVLLYDFTHKRIALSPALMALCRFLLFLAAGSAAEEGVTGEGVWTGLVLGLYIVGLSTVARGESVGGPTRGWPLAALLAPVFLAGFRTPPEAWFSPAAGLPVLLLLVWGGRSLAQLRSGTPAGAQATVSGLLAGIVLVDAVAVAPPAWPWGCVFLALFGLALLMQRRIPAT